MSGNSVLHFINGINLHRDFENSVVHDSCIVLHVVSSESALENIIAQKSDDTLPFC